MTNRMGFAEKRRQSAQKVTSARRRLRRTERCWYPDPLRLEKTTKRRKALTVGIAAIANWNGPIVIGATDAMLTAGDIEFEPPMAKIYRFSTKTLSSVAALSVVHDVARGNGAVIRHWRSQRRQG